MKPTYPFRPEGPSEGIAMIWALLLITVVALIVFSNFY